MSEPISWMPVFIVVEAARTVHASVPPQATDPHQTVTVHGQDFWQRVGTAYPRPDGGFTIQLTAIPINGKLVVRPPKAGEHRDVTDGSY
jgi:hypothetical protein